ncbi:MAG: GTPase Era, partial [Acidovorax sp.]|nr:GTPase Era [Acidovorax sp.]
MTDAAKKKVAGKAGAERAKGQIDINDPSLDYISAMLAGAKPGAAATPIRSEEESAAEPAREVPVEQQRCGLIAIVGKPNVGKSTLMNALVGQKISITSRKAQTTRHRITGIHTKEETQFVFVDTPGFQTKHSTALNKSLNKTVMGAIGDVDLILFVVEAGQFTLADAKVLSLF